MRIFTILILAFSFSCMAFAEDGVPPGGEPSPGSELPGTGSPQSDSPESEPTPESQPPRKNRGRDRDARMRGRVPNWERFAERFDKNGDGKITRDEVEGRMQRNFDRIDVDGDGAISKQDLDAVRSRAGNSPRQGQRGATRRANNTLSAQRLDTNRDKKISADEWKAFHERSDKNGDGVLDREEWLSAVSGKAVRDGAPSVGSRAPNVSAKRLGSDQVIDLGRPTRFTVLIFGSHT